ncbi:MFS transporter [Mesobacillus harenae]|uniref:MFS transporter n=1 Tax=Mesobacillus harenae TaxID=2213203 RepID=UPI00157FD403|nr:MFS transporter [Mesobacillus harenae]
MKTGMFKPLQNKSYRSLFSAQVFSDLGNWLDFVTIQVIVAYQWGLGETAVAAVIIALALPWVIVGPLASVFVDRLPKKQTMIACLVLRIVFVAGIFAAPNLYILLLFVFLKATVAALYDPARQSSIRLTVPEDQLPEAVTLSQLSVNLTKIIGPALGGGLIAGFGVRSPLIFEAAGFLLAVLILLTLPKLEETITAEKTMKHTSYWGDLREGFQHILSVKLLKVAILLSSAAFFIIFLYDGLLVFIAQELGFGKEDFGLLISSVGFGSVAGALLLGKWTEWKSKPVHLMSAASVFGGMLILSLGLGCLGIFNLPRSGWLAGGFIIGILGSAQSIPYGYVLQAQTPKHMMARVSSTAMALQTFSMLIAPAAGALLAKWMGISIVMMGAGIATTLLGLYMIIFIVKALSSTSKLERNSVQM